MDSFAAAAAAALLLPVLLAGLVERVAAEGVVAGRGLSSRLGCRELPLGDELKLMWLCVKRGTRQGSTANTQLEWLPAWHCNSVR
jgi:hypothetical protein